MMSHNLQVLQHARGQVQVGIQRLAEKYPFHAAVIERLDVQCRADVGTMGVTVAGDKVRMLYDPLFVLETSMDELVGVLLHEVHHVVFGHILVDLSGFPDQWTRTVAEEVSANEFIEEPLPGEPIRLQLFPGLPPMESTDERYDRLKQ